jgi:hypothetical protein
MPFLDAPLPTTTSSSSEGLAESELPPEMPQEEEEQHEEEEQQAAPQPARDLETALQEMVADPGIDVNLKRRILMILEKIANHYLLDDLAQTVEFSLTKFVDTDTENEAPAKLEPEPRHERRPSGKAPRHTLQKWGSFKHRVQRPLNLRDDRPQGFARDLALAIIEGERYMRPYVMKYCDSAAGRSALDDIAFIRSKVKEKLEPIVQTVVFPKAEELTVNGRTKRLPPQKVKPMREPQRPRTAISQPPTLTVGLGNGRDTSLLGKRKPRPTKFEAVETERPGDFFLGEPCKGRKAKDVPVIRPKWRSPRHPTVTHADLNMFLFISPFVAPPQAIADMIRDAEQAT